jgi:hypothetical protein
MSNSFSCVEKIPYVEGSKLFAMSKTASFFVGLGCLVKVFGLGDISYVAPALLSFGLYTAIAVAQAADVHPRTKRKRPAFSARFACALVNQFYGIK